MTISNFVKSLIDSQNNASPVQRAPSCWRFNVARAMLTGIINNQYYRSADLAVQEALPLILDAAVRDPAFLLKACTCGKINMMRELGVLALSAKADHEFLQQNHATIIALLETFHPGQLLQFVEIMKCKVLGRGFGRRPQGWVQKVMLSWTPEQLEEFTIKYPSDLKVLLRLVHPSYDQSRSNLVRYVLGSVPGGKRQKALERIKTFKNDHDIAWEMIEHSVPWDVVKGFHPVKGEVGLAMMTPMGLSELLLNTRSLEQNGVLDTPEALLAYEIKLHEVKHVIPLDFAKSYIYSGNPTVKSYLFSAIVNTLSRQTFNIEDRNIGVSIDVSGSMRGEPLMTAGLLAVPFLKSKLWFTTFDTECYEEGVRNSAGDCRYLCPLLQGLTPSEQVANLLSLHTYGATDVSVSLKRAIQNQIKLDLHVLITDDQQNAGKPLMEIWRQYKRRINPQAELWIINATNYQWQSADMSDPSVTIYQSMTPAIFKNLQFFGQDLVSLIEGTI